MLARTLTRNFWKVTSGTGIGYIETQYQRGILFTNDFVDFRNTSSNLASSDTVRVSISKLSEEQRGKLASYMARRVPVSMVFEHHLLGSPFKGEIGEPMYALQVTPLTEETISVQAIHK